MTELYLVFTSEALDRKLLDEALDLELLDPLLPKVDLNRNLLVELELLLLEELLDELELLLLELLPPLLLASVSSAQIIVESSSYFTMILKKHSRTSMVTYLRYII